MAYTTINKPNQYFETTTYAGGTTAITSLDFSPDLVWAKKRTGIENHGIFDSVRGVYQTINSNTTDAESTRSGALTSFDSNGWSMGGADGIISAAGSDYVGWAWRGSDSSPVTNNDGSITSTVSASTTSGFSIVSWTGTGALATVGHGLGVAPKVLIIKNRTTTGTQWAVFHQSVGNTKALQLDSTDAPATSTNFWNDTSPTSSVFTVKAGTDNNQSGASLIAYCFAEIKGFSKFGSYVGNGSADGPFIYTGFKPAMIITKKTSVSGDNWQIRDNKRDTYNEANRLLKPNASTAEQTTDAMDYYSNGFKWRNSAGEVNASGATFIYMAFAENPLVTTSGVPATAR